jgi:hypothetical protein
MVQQTVTPTSLTTSAYTAITWDTILDDRWKMATSGSASIVVPRAGLYLCEGAVAFQQVVVAHRFFVALQYSAAQWRGTAIINVPSGDATTGVSRLMKLLAGDTIKLAAFQDTGGPINTGPGIENAPYFNVLWLRP